MFGYGVTNPCTPYWGGGGGGGGAGGERGGRCPGAGASLRCLCHAGAAASEHMLIELDLMYVHLIQSLKGLVDSAFDH